jgi:hypothetical protein
MVQRGSDAPAHARERAARLPVKASFCLTPPAPPPPAPDIVYAREAQKGAAFPRHRRMRQIQKRPLFYYDLCRCTVCSVASSSTAITISSILMAR